MNTMNATLLLLLGTAYWRPCWGWLRRQYALWRAVVRAAPTADAPPKEPLPHSEAALDTAHLLGLLQEWEQLAVLWGVETGNRTVYRHHLLVDLLSRTQQAVLGIRP